MLNDPISKINTLLNDVEFKVQYKVIKTDLLNDLSNTIINQNKHFALFSIFPNRAKKFQYKKLVEMLNKVLENFSTDIFNFIIYYIQLKDYILIDKPNIQITNLLLEIVYILIQQCINLINVLLKIIECIEQEEILDFRTTVDNIFIVEPFTSLIINNDAFLKNIDMSNIKIDLIHVSGLISFFDEKNKDKDTFANISNKLKNISARYELVIKTIKTA